MNETFDEMWESLRQERMPKKCKGCECGSMQLVGEYPHIDWEYVCELNECYQEEETNG